MAKKTYTETLRDIEKFMSETEERGRLQDEVVKKMAVHLDECQLPVVGVLEAQLEHVIQGLGEMKGSMEVHRKEARRERDAIRECMSSIKGEVSSMRQWCKDQDDKVMPEVSRRMDGNESDIKDLEKEVDNLWKTTKILPVFSGVMGLAGSILGQLGIDIPTK